MSMKKKIKTGALAFVLTCFLSVAAWAAYHYGFILSCGITVYRSFDNPLSDAELLQWTDFFESTNCGAQVPEMPIH